MATEPLTASENIAPSRSGASVRTEIQALRALAVTGVLLFHLWPNRLSGGYVGVDVFFVVSGFLITDHLLREKSRTGRISLPRFWARRAKRLLPASLLVLFATTLAVWTWVPDTRWSQFGSEILSSVFYVENWALASQSVDYMALSNVKSPVQHFWSLGVEEQFYVLWPLMLTGGYFVSRLIRRRQTSAALIVIAVATAVSLSYSIYLTAAQPTVAYFSTFTRAWEFGLGALLAVLSGSHRPTLPGGWAPALSWAGFTMIAVAMFTFTGATPFPSFTALVPVLGALIVIVAGTPSSALSPTRLFSLRPVQFMGDVSYGTYLWHWPIIVLLPYIFGVPVGTAVALAVLAVSIALGWLSKRLVEDPVRSAPLIARMRPGWIFLGALLTMALTASAALPLAMYRITAPASPPADSMPSCYGALAMLDSSCAPVEEVPMVASLTSFSVDVPPSDILACEASALSPDYVRCDFGTANAGGTHVALIGDSHATRWVEPLRDALSDRGGSLSTFLVSGCAMLTSEVAGSAWGFEQSYAEQCQDKASRVAAAVAADPEVDTVILTNRTRLYLSDDPAFLPLTAAGVQATIHRLQEAGKRVIVIKDPPERSAVPPQGGQSAADCLREASSPSECSLPRAEATFADPLSAAASATGALLLNFDDLFCLADRCLSRIGGLVVYSDDNHMSRSFALSLVPILSDRLVPALTTG